MGLAPKCEGKSPSSRSFPSSLLLPHSTFNSRFWLLPLHQEISHPSSSAPPYLSLSRPIWPNLYPPSEVFRPVSCPIFFCCLYYSSCSSLLFTIYLCHVVFIIHCCKDVTTHCNTGSDTTMWPENELEYLFVSISDYGSHLSSGYRGLYAPD
jgi:hypothetical protein